MFYVLKVLNVLVLRNPNSPISLQRYNKKCTYANKARNYLQKKDRFYLSHTIFCTRSCSQRITSHKCSMSYHSTGWDVDAFQFPATSKCASTDIL